MPDKFVDLMKRSLFFRFVEITFVLQNPSLEVLEKFKLMIQDMPVENFGKFEASLNDITNLSIKTLYSVDEFKQKVAQFTNELKPLHQNFEKI